MQKSITFKLFTMVMVFCLLGSGFTNFAVIPAEAASDIRFINNEEDLISFSKEYQISECKEMVVLTSDITLNNNGNDVTPIANFSGTFDGGGHTISGLKITAGENIGLFAKARNAEIRNVTVANSVIKTSGNYAGAIIGDGENVRLNNCHSIDNVIYSFIATGGIAGRLLNNGTEVKNCSNEGGTVTSNRYPGGIVGSTMGWHGVIENCFNTATVQGIDVFAEPAGICAYGWKISNCYSIGKMSAKTGYKTYAICSKLGDSIEDCYYAEGIADASYNANAAYSVTEDGVEMMSASDMQEDAFIEMLNENRGSVKDWFEWVRCENKDYPVLAKCKDISDSEIAISLPQLNYEYTGNPIEPVVKVSSDSDILGKDFDYVVTYKDNTNIGTATVTVMGINRYCGTRSLEFTIEPAVVNTEASTQTNAQATTETSTQVSAQNSPAATTQPVKTTSAEQNKTQVPVSSVSNKAQAKKTKKLSKKQKALEAYKIFLKDKNSDDAFPKNEFGLMDINKDGVPELVVTPDNMYHANIYGYVNGKIKDIGYAFSGKCEFYPKKSLYYMTSTHTGDDTRSYYIYDGKKMKRVAYAHGCDYQNAITGKKKTSFNGFKPYKYVVKGKRVSKAKFDRYVKKLIGNAKKQKPVMRKNNAANRKKYL